MYYGLSVQIKTGTLTTNEMTVVNITIFDRYGHADDHEVTGLSYSPLGDVQNLEYLQSSQKALCKIEEVCALCNESSIHFNESTQKYQAVGEPTEAALHVLVEKLGLPDQANNVCIVEMRMRFRSNDMSRIFLQRQLLCV